MNKTFPEDGGDPAVEGEEDAEEKTLLKQTQELDTCATTSKV